MSFDVKCHDLAGQFLLDEPGYADLTVQERCELQDELAQDIQDQIEASLDAFRDNKRFGVI